MKIMKSFISLLLALAILASVVLPASAQTKTMETPYGKLTGSLEGTGGWVNNYGFKGRTSCSERRRLNVKVEVRQNTSGELEDSDSKEIDSAKSVSITVYGEDKITKKAGYGTHEIRGQSSYTVYTVETKG